MTKTSMEALLWEFDQSLHAGKRLPLESILEQVPSSEQAELLVELISIELQHDWLTGSGRTIDDYRALYQEILSSSATWDALVQEEFIARRRAGLELSDDELTRRFGHRAKEFGESWQTICRDFAPVSDHATKKYSHPAGWIGRVLANRFELQEQVGQGAFADVFRAYDRVLHREVAVKLTRHSLSDESEEGQRFFREAESIAQLQHPGIIAIHEFGREADRLFIVEEYLPDGTLEHRMQLGPTSPEQAAKWMQEICIAVDYAHQCGVIHRDLKPANVLIDREGRLKVGDFGLAIRSETEIRLTNHGRLLGTPAYMSPEQVRGQAPVKATTDVYALGAILYHLVTGQIPFQGSTATVLNQILHTDPVSLRRVRKAIPPDLETICLVAMAKEPTRRYSTARELSEDLRRFLASEPLLARRTGWVGQLRLWVRRQPLTAAVILIASTLIAMTVIVSFVRITQERDLYRLERDRANSALCLSSISNVESELQVRSSGWFERAQSYLTQAAGLVDSHERQGEVRDLAAKLFLESAPRIERIANIAFEPAPNLRSESLPVSTAITALSIDPMATDWVAVGTQAGEVYLCRIGTGEKHLLTRFDRRVAHLEWLAESRELFVLADQVLTLLKVDQDLESVVSDWSTSLVFRNEGDVATFAYSRIDHKLACGLGGGRIEIKRRLQDEFVTEKSWHAHGDRLVHVTFSDDGLLLASSSEDRSLKCWDSRTGELVSARLLSEAARSLSFVADGTELLWTTWESFTYFRAPIQGSVQELAKMMAPWRWVAETVDRQVISVSTDGQMMLWKANQQRAQLRNDSEWTILKAVASSNVFAAGTSTGNVQVFAVQGSRMNIPFPTRHAITTDAQGHLYNEYGQLDPETPTVQRTKLQWNDASGLAVGRNSDLVAIATLDGDVRVIRNGTTKRIPGIGKDHFAKLAIGNRDAWLATCSQTGPIRIWDTNTMELVREIPVDLGQVFSIAMQPDGEGLIAAGRRGTYMYLPGQAPRALNDKLQYRCALAWVEGAIALSLSDGQIAVYKDGAPDPTFLLGAIDPIIHSLAFAPDGSTLFALYQNKDLVSWDLDVGRLKQKRTFDAVHDLMAVDPLGRLLIVQTIWGRSKLLDLTSLQPLGELGYGGRWALFSSDGQRLWLARQGLAYYDRTALESETFAKDTDSPQHGSNERVLELEPTFMVSGGNTETVWSIDISPNNRWMATGSFDRRTKIWDVESGALLNELDLHRDMVWRVRFSPDNRFLATGSADSENPEGEINLWRTEDWSIAASKRIGTRLVGAIDFHPTLPWIGLATFDGRVALLDSANLDSLHSAHPFRHAIVDLKFHPQGHVMAGACLGDGVGIWKVANGPQAADQPLSDPRFLKAPGERVWAIAFSSDERVLAAGCESGVINLYDTRDWNRIATLPTGRSRLRYLRFSPDDNRLYASVFSGDGCIIELDQVRARLKPLGLDW